MDIVHVSNKRVPAESRDQPGEHKASTGMGVNNVWLKVAEIPSKDKDGFYERQRTTSLIERKWVILSRCNSAS